MQNDNSSRDSLYLFTLSFAVLFLELALIRYIPSYFRMLSFFSNFLLLSCFFGMSLGMLRQRGFNFFPWSLPLSGLAVALVTKAQLGAEANFGTEGVLFFGSEFGSESRRAVPLTLALLIVFLVFGGIFYGLGQELMVRLKRLPSLRGYSINLWGSVAGSVCYTAMSASGAHPSLWFLLVCLSLAPGWPNSKLSWAAFGLGSLLLVGGSALDFESRWSPYNRVFTNVMADGTVGIYVNGISHQQMFAADENTGYALPYRGYMTKAGPPEVIIVGAGSGNDVSAALACGVKHVEAVEIDPVINRFGVQFHPRRPYQDPRVHINITDGRRFLRTFPGKVDIVSFGLVDSLTLLSGFSSTRLENNLFTEPSFADAKALLRPGGLLVVYNDFRECWLVGRYYRQLVDLFGEDKVLMVMLPYRATMSVNDGSVVGSAMLIAGDIEPVRNWLHSRPGGSPETNFDDTWKSVEPATDNWPFPYLRRREIPSHNIWSSALLLGLSGLTLRLALGKGSGRIQWRMFWLGAGFMLIETRGIGRMSLLFGTSWRGSSLSILFVLLLALLANEVARRLNLERKAPLILAGLLACLALDGVVPVNSLLDLPMGLRLLAAAGILFSPMFFSGLLFSQALSKQQDAAEGLGSNLLGAMVGGALENLTTVLGLKGILGVAVCLYLLAYRSR